MRLLAALLLAFSVPALAGAPKKGHVACGDDLNAVLRSQMPAIPDGALQECQDGVHSAIRFGRIWVFFKSDAAAYLMDHKEYEGPCLRSYRHSPSVVDLCSK